ERRREALREPPRVDEDERRAMGVDQLQQPRMNGRPDRRLRRADDRVPAPDLADLAELRHLLDGYFDFQDERLFLAGVDDGDIAKFRFAMVGEFGVENG